MNSKSFILLTGFVALVALIILCLLKHLEPIRAKTSAADLGVGGPFFTLETQSNVVVLRGRLPDDGIRNILHSLTGASFDPRTVVDSLEIVPGLAEAPWGQAALVLLPVVAKTVTNARLVFRANTVTVYGSVLTESHKLKLRQALDLVRPVAVLIDSMNVIHGEGALGPEPTIDSLVARNTIDFQTRTASKTDLAANVVDEFFPLLRESQESLADDNEFADSTFDPENDVLLTAKERVDAQQAIETILARNTIEFQRGTATLTTGGKMTLDTIVPFLRGLHETVVTIEGHCDSEGDPVHNLHLSRERADAVKVYMMKKGVNGDLLETRGYGSTRPRVKDDSPAARQRNRRVEITLR